MDAVLNTIIEGDDQKVPDAIINFVEMSAQTFAFPELNQDNKRANVWRVLYTTASTSTDERILKACFAAVRILSREKISIDELITCKWFDLAKRHAGLGEDAIKLNFLPGEMEVCVEVEKCLCNLVFNSSVAAAMCCKNDVLLRLTQRIKHFPQVPREIRFFDVKLIFLLTALCPEVRPTVKDDMEGITSLVEIVKEVIRGNNETLVEDQDVDLVCEVLKALFNITAHCYGEEEDREQCENLVTILRTLLSLGTGKEKGLTLRNNIVNLLTNIPNDMYKHLYLPTDNQDMSDFYFSGQDMKAVYQIVALLEDKLSDEPGVAKQQEILSPVVSVLLKGATGDRILRKYLRSRILPPLKDVHHRPEEGSTVRNSLCRLLTSPVTQLRDMVSDLLFTLCKNNVNRMIKYTGYGNAAGLFARRGLLNGRASEEADFSPDSDGSETEEYAEHKHGINPVTGKFEPPHPSPMANMTEEQKEHEAMKLVQLMSNLTKCGAIKPCRVGPDGKPHPIEHVLELQQGLKVEQDNDDDDEI